MKSKPAQTFSFLAATAGAVALFAANTACAQLIAQYPISSSPGSFTPLDAVSVAPRIVAEPMTLSSGVTPIWLSQTFEGVNWSQSGFSTTDYIQFGVTVQQGYQLDPQAITYALARGSGPGQIDSWELRLSTDQFATPGLTVGSHNLSSAGNYEQRTFTDSLAAVPNLTGTVTFRLYGYGSTVGSPSSGGFFNFTGLPGTGSDVFLTGTVSPVPEPAWAASVFGLALLAFAWARSSGRTWVQRRRQLL